MNQIEKLYTNPDEINLKKQKKTIDLSWISTLPAIMFAKTEKFHYLQERETLCVFKAIAFAFPQPVLDTLRERNGWEWERERTERWSRAEQKLGPKGSVRPFADWAKM